MKQKNVRYIKRDYKPNYKNNRPSSSLPSPAMLESYEEISPGFTERLLELTKQKQEQQKNWEDNYLKSMNMTMRIGQILAFLFSIVVLIISTRFFYEQQFGSGAVLFITWFVFFFLMNRKYRN
ncbi:DUF2335 domain-containing protein [Candidatus Bandiella euplotis]|uniref:DUF2335 super family protein n=1 Tax=Candidatus Bandiella euplotis TaxID=1664265 RepID=A0ABZ0ULC2_9RICK|nr:DUF2335 super family protein [Candidatus Bandiella woodruffii]